MKVYLLDTETRLYREYAGWCTETNYGRRLSERALSEGLSSIIDFIREIGAQGGYKIRSLLKMFKDSRVFKFFAAFKFDFSSLKAGFKSAIAIWNQLTGFLPNLLADLAEKGIEKFTTAEFRARAKEISEIVSAWLRSHALLLKVSGIVLACLVMVIWINCAFTGNTEIDFGLNTVLDALSGRLTLPEFFMSRDGLLSLILLATGVLGLSFKWFSTPINIAVAIVRTLATRGGHHLEKGKDSPADIEKAAKSV